MIVRERLDAAPDGFAPQGDAPADQILNLRLALVQGDPAGLEDALMAVSTPGNDRYGKFLTKEEVEAFVAPKPEAVQAVNAYLAEHGLTAQKYSPAGDWLSVDVSVTKANALLGTEFTTFLCSFTNTTSVRTLEYSIPASLQGYLDFVHPTVTFPEPLQRQPLMSIPLPQGASPAVTDANGNLSSNAVPASCSSVITPACLQALYGIPSTKATQKSNTMAVTGYLNEYANQADLKSFLSSLRPDLPSSTSFTLQTIDGGSNPQGIKQAGLEADLDTQYTIGVASGVPVAFISVGGNTRDGVFGFQDTVNFLLSENTIPHVVTTSYGGNENQISRPLANSLCNSYMQLGARGTSVFFSSGDGGVSGTQSGSCSTFVPTFPSGCPFLTSVGATSGIPETSASFSSGGFSNYFGIPSYQSSAVQASLQKLGTTDSGKFNRSGRGFPDVAAQGNNVEIFNQGNAGLVAGTSCSAPIFASIVALLNDQLIAAKKSPLGFLNPFLYSTAGKSALNDITSGNNPGCNTNGFSAAAGWDPVTGLGTPNYAALKKAVGL
ncbi:family S53 protease [Artomyces pyxidatus]|uniref:Family S53 protease n=1 Tax=Artomyces pyxidatus TaxID=48021 RepID=A0ACB8T245_9AGAM|nr:family S53 protease [Artomyces pyxidatus]